MGLLRIFFSLNFMQTKIPLGDWFGLRRERGISARGNKFDISFDAAKSLPKTSSL
jgi:hypothetical protein